MATRPNEYKLVAALDFGTVYSGYAFAIRKSSNIKDDMIININPPWNAGGHQLLSIKTPTTLLLDQNKQVIAFGYHAENRYTDIIMDGEQDDYYYFRRFKMNLYEQEGLSLDTMLSDIRGKSLPAIEVFALSIQCLKHHLLTNLLKEGVDIKESAIQWVLTVPSIWSDTAKHFMRQSAEKAGIPNENLLMALESEAASIFYHHLAADRYTSNDICSKKGSQYMVVDIGGGTTDITTLKNIGQNKLEEISRATGENCGGIAVDKEFYGVFYKIVGKEVLDDMARSFPTAYLDLFREFECVKRYLTPEREDKVTMSIPILTLTQLCEKHHKKHFLAMLKASRYSHQITIVHDKLRIESNLLKSLFKFATEKIVKLVNNTLNEIENKRSIQVILVGGFSESHFVQKAVKSSLPYKVIVPSEATVAVLKGAVLFAAKPEVISSRVMRFTYGFQVSNDFNPKRHSYLKEVEVDGLKLCEKVFERFVEINKRVTLGESIKETFTTTKKFQDIHYLPLYTSIDKDPEYTDDDSCKHVGTVVVRIPNPTDRYRDVEVIISFGHTELKMEAVDQESGNACQTSFQYV